MALPRLSRLPAFLAARAVDAGWLRGDRAFRRFVVLGWYRTGSNLLLGLLNSDPAVVAYSEVLSPRGPFWGNHAYAPRGDSARLERLRTEDAPAFLEEAVFRPHPTRVRAVGFKLFYPQLVVKPVPGLARALAEMPDLAVLHLRRRNLLEVLVSTRVARQTGQMASTSAARSHDALRRAGPVVLTPDECASYFREVEEFAEASVRLFDRADVLDLEYERLAADPQGETTRARSFLGLPPSRSDNPLVKQRTRPLDEVVENLDELRTHFVGTRWETFFS